MVTMYKSVLLVFTVIAPVYSLMVIDNVKKDLSHPLRNLLFHNGKLYVGGLNNIYVLDKNLSVHDETTTCDNSVSNCRNDNSLLLIKDVSGNEKYLINCGTGYSGICQVRDLDNITNVEKNNSELVSSNINRPVQGMITEKGKLMLAVTFGDGIPSPQNSNNSYRYAISKRTVKTLALAGSATNNPHITLKTDGDYVIYYKSSFKSADYIYFTTIQKESMNENKYTSKLVRLCQNDIEFISYVDMPINCMNKGTTYNLLQTAVIAKTNSGVVFVGAFTHGNNPEEPENESVICVKKLSSLDKGLEESFKTFAITNVSKTDPKRYLPDLKTSAISEDDYLADDFACKHIGVVNIKYAIGTETLHMEAVDIPIRYTKAENGLISTLHATKLEDHDVIFAGTSAGWLYQFNLENQMDNLSLSMYNNQTIDEGSEIKGIREDGDFIYVLSQYKLFRLKSTDCSEFTTCQETMDVKNPHCGWCVFADRASRKNGLCLSSEWIHSYEKCIELKTSNSGIKVGTVGGKVEVTVNNFDKVKQNSSSFSCKFSDGQNLDETVIAEDVKSTTFKCSIPVVGAHTEATLELIVNGSVSLASTPFLFYSCVNYTSCGACVGSVGAKCEWDIADITCKVPGKAGGSAVNNVSKCPSLKNNNGKNFLAADERIRVKLDAFNVGNTSKLWCYVRKVDGIQADAHGKIDYLDNQATCDLNITLTKPSKGLDVPIYIKYGNEDQFKPELPDFEDEFDNKVTVYSCSELGQYCSQCKALKDHYTCVWNTHGCIYSLSKVLQGCPAPIIHKVIPLDGPKSGGTMLTIDGTELGTEKNDINSITIGGASCSIEDVTIDESLSVYFQKRVPTSIVCKTGWIVNDSVDDVIVTVNGRSSTVTKKFSYKTAKLTDMKPVFGPLAGGTKLTFFGDNLGIGNRKVIVGLDQINCLDAKVMPEVGFGVDINFNFTIQCNIPIIPVDNRKEDTKFIHLAGVGEQIKFEKVFTFLPNPTIEGISPKKGTSSGGTGVTLTGKNFTNCHNGKIEGSFEGELLTSVCKIISDTKTVCKAPVAPKSVKTRIMNEINSSRRKRSDCSECIKVDVKVYLDGFSHDFQITYYQDPHLSEFEGNEGVRLLDSGDQRLTIKGKYINLVAQESDINITIGLETCSVFELREDSITCLAPKDQPAKGRQDVKFPEVNVTIGNYHVRVGYLEYIIEREILIYIIGGVAGGLVAIIVLGIVIGVYKFRKVGKKAKAYEKNLSDMEMEIKRVAREEFLDMHTTMSSVNKNLVEQGFPYHSYQQFACNVMFSVDYLWTEPVVSNGKMTDDERLKANRGMESLESLIYNKFFLVSVITTMENEKRFFIREKSNLAGNLCAVLMGRMDYLDEILKLLMNNLVQDSPAKKHKTLFRRCESITEKLLSNWLSLCLYPHVKSHSGSPLYLLYMATQKTMESGPIDAVTGDAKYTLSEEKLLKKWSSSIEDDNDNKDLKFEAKTLTLNVVVDNGDEIFKCKALDCDTISQVKNKCLNQIYVNFPSSRLPVGANDLALEWHEGFGGTLKLRDTDNTSKRDGHWLRLNTLAHYNVKDESNMALIDPHSPDVNLQEDYVNLANINMEGVCDGSIDSNQPLTLHDEENPHEFDHWHLVKREEESSKQGKGAIAELYLNRLFTTKQSLMEYMRPLFDIILDHDRCPPPTKFLYDYLDELGEKYKVDIETVHAWKSHSYAIRVWASLMKMPNMLFDVSIPTFMDDNLEIISQAFIESFSLTTQKCTKDTPPQKLIFHHERNQYRERVKEFYKNVKVDSEDVDRFRQYMAEVNRIQQGTEFNKVSALYRLYKQLKPYFEDILENLATSKEASNLQLDRKLEQVIAIMEEDD